MSDVTQLSDEFLFDHATTSAQDPIKISRGKTIVPVIDLQQGSYTSGIVSIDATNQLSGAKGYASLSEAYITVPYVVTLNNGVGALTSTPANISQFVGGLKCNTASVIDRIQIELGGKTLVTPISYLSHWNNLRALTEWSDSDIKTHGASAMMFPDDVVSIGFNNTTNAAGDGYINNSNNVAAVLAATNTALVEYPVNSGFVKRQLCNPMVISSNGVPINSVGWASTGANAIKSLTTSSGKGAIVVGSGVASGNVITFYYMLRIRLVDIHPIFKTLDLCANPALKLTVYFNTGSSIINVDASKNMSLGSVSIVQGNVCPFMLSSATSGSGMSSVLSTNASTLNLAWGVCQNTLTSTATAASYYPYSTTRLWIPFYDLLPEKELELIKYPKKVCRYLDVATQIAKNLTGAAVSTTGALNANFGIQMSGSQKNLKYVALMPFASSSVSGTTGNFSTITNIDQAMSPFDSAPWTCQPGSNITNFQVQVGNQNVFNNPISYDFSGFLDEFQKISSLYGGMSHQLGCGLIDEDKWSYGQRIMLADVSRITSKDVPQSVLVSGTNASSQPSDFILLSVYEKAFSVDRITGEVEVL